MPGTSLDWLDDELAALARDHLLRELHAYRTGQKPGLISIGDRHYVNFSSNDYLGLTHDVISPDLKMALEHAQWGSGASPLVTGRSEKHALLEVRVAEFKGTPAALTFPTGFAANLGTIAALTGEQDLILSDARNHASIIDGCRLSAATVWVYRHKDVDHLRELLNESSSFRRRLIVTDTLFSMDGDVAPLPQIAQLSREYRCMLMVDEAHATGIYGTTGRGLAEHFQCEEAVDVTVGTFSKALGSIGGFVAGSEPLVDWLSNCARSYVFSTALPAACVCASMDALQMVQSDPDRRKQVLEKAGCFRETLQAASVLDSGFPSQIVPLLVETPEKAIALSRELQSQGMLVPAIRPPTVAAGHSLLRVSVSRVHTQLQLDQLAEIFIEHYS
ncbi:MAG TPA: 8-amino-7-oxononanoate synthase [Planctomycetaceae bacterium]|nr:8-amino-7-oxononanoate synthase [Planctomycetaceae bacterium]